MLRVYAPLYVAIGEMYQKYLLGAAIGGPDTMPTVGEHKALLQVFTDLRDKCLEMHLPVSTKSLNKAIAEFKTTPPSTKLVEEKMKQWFSCFVSELETTVFVIVLPHRLSYLPFDSAGLEESYGGDIVVPLINSLVNFEDAIYDAHEAGLCFAFERFTACVYHLMRCAEFGLVSVAKTANTPAEKINKGWDGCIGGIDSHINALRSANPKSDGWQDEVKKFSDLSSWFTTISRGWRNPVSHIPRTYSESTASGMFSATRTLFEHLNRYGFGQAEMPKEPLSPEEVQP